MGLLYTIRFPGGFRDGNVWPEFIPPGKVLEVDERQFKRFKQSDPFIELIATRVPPPTKASKKK